MAAHTVADLVFADLQVGTSTILDLKLEHQILAGDGGCGCLVILSQILHQRQDALQVEAGP
jgi:hypothetical protein